MMNEGLRLFAGFLEANNITPAEAGRQLNCTRVAVYKWLDGSQRPEPPMRNAIEAWTKGEVGRDSWLTEEERARAAAIEPFEPHHANTGTDGH